MIIEETPEGRLLVDAWEVAQQTFFNIQGQINARMMRAFLPESRDAILAEYQEAKDAKDRANQDLIDGLTALQQASGDYHGVPGEEAVAEPVQSYPDSSAA